MLQVIVGPMYAGKTTELCRRIKKYMLAKRHAILVKSAIDTRYTKNPVIINHENLTIARDNIVIADQLASIRDELMRADVIGIDEGQFYKDLSSEVEYLLMQGKTIIVSALDSDYSMSPWDEVIKLLPMASTFEKYLGVCDCGEDAVCSSKMTTNTSSRIEVGGQELYRCQCLRCKLK